MEIMILGALLVALMVYVSTRIKKTAADAFVEEVHTDERFTIVKPEGFLHPVDPNPRFPFEAYSKDFGADDAEQMRQARVRVEVSETPFAAARDAARAEPDRILTEEEVENMYWLRGEKTENGVATEIYRKIVARGDRTCDLRIQVLREHVEDYAARIVRLLESFEVK